MPCARSAPVELHCEPDACVLISRPPSQGLDKNPDVRRFERPTVPLDENVGLAPAPSSLARAPTPLTKKALETLDAALCADAVDAAVGSGPWVVTLVGHAFCCPSRVGSGAPGGDDGDGRCCPWIQTGQAVLLDREPDNPQDSHAIRVLHPSPPAAIGPVPLGHLPRTVAAVLAPWLDRGQITVSAAVFRLQGRASMQLTLDVIKK